MKKRQALVASILLLLGLATIACYAIFGGLGSQINPDSFTKIKSGMTQGQVEAILGGPPRDETGRKYQAYASGSAGGWIEYWNRTTCRISVVFDDDDRVLQSSLTCSSYRQAGLWDVLRTWCSW
jgi:outer membrane protein assembly factor BamE (lipoprotein component of BamABCDE complex)